MKKIASLSTLICILIYTGFEDHVHFPKAFPTLCTFILSTFQ